MQMIFNMTSAVDDNIQHHSEESDDRLQHTMPTLIIHGAVDVIGGEWAPQWALLAGEPRLLVLGGATRYPWIEDPGYFTAALAHFLQPA